MTDLEYMQYARELAQKGEGFVSPNPMVGAVIVKGKRIIGEGYHQRYGEAHAERNALLACTESPVGATMYVTLEPCCHQGKQPPCVDAIIEAGIQKVVVGAKDPNPLVAGKGIRILRSHGIEVVEDVDAEACQKQNEVFFHYIQTGKPYVVMKYAMSLDGKIATRTGASKWITGEVARAHVHNLRHRYRGIMVGVQTVIADDPMLTCRKEGGRNPIRIICDSKLRTPITANVVQTANEIPTILATCCTEASKYKDYQDAGCELIFCKEKDGRIDLVDLMGQLGKRKIDSILLEGGATLNWAMAKEGIIQKVMTYVAPKLIGGVDAKTPIGGNGIEQMEEALLLKPGRITQIGEDFLIESEVG